MNIRISDRARTRIRAEDEWWRLHRSDAPDLFKQELAQAFERILRAPRVRQIYATIEGAPIWRVLMPVTEQHVYFSIDEQADELRRWQLRYRWYPGFGWCHQHCY